MLVFLHLWNPAHLRTQTTEHGQQLPLTLVPPEGRQGASPPRAEARLGPEFSRRAHPEGQVTVVKFTPFPPREGGEQKKVSAPSGLGQSGDGSNTSCGGTLLFCSTEHGIFYFVNFWTGVFESA